MTLLYRLSYPYHLDGVGLEPTTHGLKGKSGWIAVHAFNILNYQWQPRWDSNPDQRPQKASGFRDRRVNLYTTGHYYIGILSLYNVG